MARKARREVLPALPRLFTRLHPDAPAAEAGGTALWETARAFPGCSVLAAEADGEPVSTCTVTVIARAAGYKLMLMTGSREENTLRFYERAGYNRTDKTGFVRWL